MAGGARQHSRRAFLGTIGGAGAAAALGDGTAPPPGDWDLRWIEQVRRARHRALFDAPQAGAVLMLAARYLDNIAAAYGAAYAAATPDVVAVLNLRTRAVHLALGDALWQRYPIGEDTKVNDPVTGAPARRNVDRVPAPDATPAYAAMTLERLHQRGAIFLVCDFALGHLATRLAEKAGGGRTADAVHAELRAGLVAGAVLVPSGIFGAAEAQNAGCAFVPA
jgi:hypothetical protein